MRSFIDPIRLDQYRLFNRSGRVSGQNGVPEAGRVTQCYVANNVQRAGAPPQGLQINAVPVGTG